LQKGGFLLAQKLNSKNPTGKTLSELDFDNVPLWMWKTRAYITAVLSPILIKDIVEHIKSLYSDNSTDLFEHKHFLNTRTI